MPLTLIQRFVCDVCGEERSVLWPEMSPPERVDQFYLPAKEWKWVDGKLVCPNHVVRIETELQ